MTGTRERGLGVNIYNGDGPYATMRGLLSFIECRLRDRGCHVEFVNVEPNMLIGEEGHIVMEGIRFDVVVPPPLDEMDRAKRTSKATNPDFREAS